MKSYFAHTAPQQADWEPLKDHLVNVAKRANKFATVFEAGIEASIAGYLHDLGKYGELFQDRLYGMAKHIDHWTPGARAAIKKYERAPGRYMSLVAHGHHIGLQQDHKTCLDRICKHDPSSNKKLSSEDINDLLHRFEEDGLEWPELPTTSYTETDKLCSDMLDIRMLFSALVDADFLETEKFMHGVEGKPQRPDVPPLNATQALGALNAHVSKIQKNGNEDVAQLRKKLFDECCKAAGYPQAAFTLSAPTGSGKTLSMLAFALQHAVTHSLERVIVVLPYLNVIEQTAKVYREVFKDFPENFPDGYIIEHHSLAGGKTDDKNDDDRERLMAENWDAPVVITTNVQFLESLFSNRPSSCRKLHNIAKSVILFDEVQTLPPELTIHSLAALSRLVERYHTSIVFATATQPAFSHLDKKIQEWCEKGWSPCPVIPQNIEDALFKNMRRVRYDWIAESLSWEALAKKIKALPTQQVLCVVNTKKQALALTKQLQETFKSCEKEKNVVFYFSTSLCAEHRSVRLEEIKERLKTGAPCYLVSTQCIEAGVDISFPEVFRAWAPLEAIIQTAGRCNRNNELFPQTGVCHVFTPEEKAFPSGPYKNVTYVAHKFVGGLDEKNKQYLDAPETIKRYYQTVYDILNHIENKEEYKELCAALQCADFVEVAKSYHLISEDTVNVIVPYGDGKALADEIWKNGLTSDRMRCAQRYSVSVRRPHSRDSAIQDILIPVKIFRRGGPLWSENWFICADNVNYSDLTGLEIPASKGFDYLER